MIAEMFITFFKIGLFSFGGGYAIISILQEQAVSRGWLKVAEFTDIVAISNMTPGPIAVNMATFVGYRMAGVAGSASATLGVALPSLIIVLIVSRAFSQFSKSEAVAKIFWGLRPVVVGMIFVACINIGGQEFFPGGGLPFGWISAIISIAAFIAMRRFKISPIITIIASGVIGLFVF